MGIGQTRGRATQPRGRGAQSRGEAHPATREGYSSSPITAIIPAPPTKSIIVVEVVEVVVKKGRGWGRSGSGGVSSSGISASG